MKVQSSNTLHQKALYLSQMGETFTLIKINNSFKLKSEYFGDLSSQSNRRIPPVELGFIKRVKNHVLSNGIYENFISTLYYPEDIQYVSVNKKEEAEIIENVIEIDIDEAYWRTAFILGVIDEKIYLEGSKEAGKISKLGRLIALGSLAKKEDRYTFNGKRLIKQEIIRSTLTENIWYSICKRVSDVMYEAKKIAGNDFIMYWVDGIYLIDNGKKTEKIIKLFSDYGYDTKIKSNLSVEYTSDKIYIHDLEKGDSRPFFIPRKKQRKSYFTDGELKETALKYSKSGVIDDEIHNL